MTQKCLFFIDDVIWTFRDLARKQPDSLFDSPFLAVLKEAWEKYGFKTQLNLFYSTDNYYGNDDFNLSEMPDRYKAEWEASSNWLKLAFHARQEFPDYPYVNASYEQVREDFLKIKEEVLRFAGEKSFTDSIVPHWLPMSYEGCCALRDLGIKTISTTYGVRSEYNGDPNSLPYGHAGRLLYHRKPETMVFTRDTNATEIEKSICGYNHVDDVAAYDAIYTKTSGIKDEKTGLVFKRPTNGICLNLLEQDALEQALDERIGKKWEFIGVANHEQYFYEEYMFCQPDYAKKSYTPQSGFTTQDMNVFLSKICVTNKSKLFGTN
ncbi:MAG: hypothetical protein IJC88_06955 [Oscillospiraceae bacterium]|nr:hypothetical protein [Oscillospiraceae bacterium]